MKLRIILSLLAGWLCISKMPAQDTIIKNTGEIIYAKVIEVGTNAITYKKNNFQDGPNFVDNKSDIFIIKYHNGHTEKFEKQAAAQVQIPASGPVVPGAVAQENGAASPSGVPVNPNKTPAPPGYKIEQVGDKYMINGQRLGSHGLDRQLKTSKNPAVLTVVKTAKLAKTFQKVVGISSYATTATGGFTSIVACNNFYKAYKGGELTSKNYVNTGLNLLGTMIMPITSNFLKNRRDKLYDRAVALYNTPY